MTVYGASRKVGRSLRELEQAWHFRYEDLGKNSMSDTYGFNVLLPRLGEVAPRLFEQQSLFAELNPDDTVLDWFGDVTSAVNEENRDSQLLDSDILGQFANYRNLTRNGISQVSIGTRRYEASGRLILTDNLGEKAQSLVIENPESKRTRLVGVLDKVAFLDRVLWIQLLDGSRVKVLWSPEDVEPIRLFWGSKVMMGGTLQYRPNGTPQVFVAEAIEAGTDVSTVWDKLPEAKLLPKAGSTRRQLRPDEINPLGELRGVLDGKFTDEEFEKMVQEFCHP